MLIFKGIKKRFIWVIFLDGYGPIPYTPLSSFKGPHNDSYGIGL